ncbi:MAG: ABC transporter permease subunit [Bdellovibrionales bacterium]|nr:ABC transporter permease subunit [Bdellovibrionales bacterium]
MKNIFLMAINTIKEVKRHKIFYALGSVVIFIVGAGVILGPLSLSEQTRLSINFSFTACHIGLIVIAVYFASTLISHEIERKTIITLFTKPISRMQFIIGKFLGLSFILLLALLFLTLFVVFIYMIYRQPVGAILFIALWGIFLEALILLAIAFFFSSFTSSFLVLVYSVLVFIIGHSANSIIFFLGKGEGDSFFKLLVSIVTRVFPNFEKLNWRAQALYQDSLVAGELLSCSIYSFSWIIFLLIITGLLFKRKQIG